MVKIKKSILIVLYIMAFIIPSSIEKNLKEGKSDNTFTTYKIMLRKLFKELFNTDKFSVEKLQLTNKVRKYLESDNISLTSKKIISIAIVMILKAANCSKDLIDCYGIMARKYRIEDKKLRANREATENEKVWHITWTWIKLMKKEYKNFLDNIDKNSITDLAYKRLYMGYIVFELLTSIPPQRGECLFNCYIDKNIRGSNTIDTKQKKWIIGESKTKKSYGERVIPLTDDIVNIIKNWKTINNCKDNLLICNDQGNKMSTQSYTQYLNNTVFRFKAPRRISTDDLRKSYVTHMIVHIGIDKKERDVIARTLGHSPQTMMSLYFKPDLETNILLGGRIL